MTTSILIQPEARTVIVGVDTHKHVHVAVAIDTRGIRLGDQSFVACQRSFKFPPPAVIENSPTPGL